MRTRAIRDLPVSAVTILGYGVYGLSVAAQTLYTTGLHNWRQKRHESAGGALFVGCLVALLWPSTWSEGNKGAILMTVGAELCRVAKFGVAARYISLVLLARKWHMRKWTI